MGTLRFSAKLADLSAPQNTLPAATANSCLAFFMYALQTQSEPI